MGNSDSRLQFRQSFQKFLNDSEIPTETFWDELLSMPQTLEDVVAALSIPDIRNLIQAHDKFTPLMHRLLTKIKRCSYGEIHLDHKHVLNAVRLLTRIIPILMEDTEIAKDTLWNTHSDGFHLLDSLMALLFTFGFTSPIASEMSATGILICRSYSRTYMEKRTLC